MLFLLFFARGIVVVAVTFYIKILILLITIFKILFIYSISYTLEFNFFEKRLHFMIFDMRYHYEKPEIYYTSRYGRTYECDHPVYDRCTLFKIENKGLAIIQQRYDPLTKTTWWTEIDPWLTDVLYLHIKFKEYFDKRSGECVGGLYPTVTIRQIMWALKIKPIPRERWETCFDRKNI